jgi:Leucine-rich repeat (LRR) protein
MFFLCCFNVCKKNKQNVQETYLVNTDHAVSKYSIDSCSRSNEYGVITELYLVDKSMTVLNEHLIYSSKHIVKMWLSKNSLSSLPVEFKELKLLSSIWLSNNMFETIPILPQNIKHIYIDNNNVVSIQGIENYLLLETLKIDCCKLECITCEIGECINLITLEAHKNYITEVTNSIGKLLKLKTLSLHSNQIIELPDELGNLKDLSYLSLHFNNISCLPSSMSNLSSLLRLSLHNNNVINISSLLMTNLQVISLFRNNLEEIPEEFCRNLTKCQKFAIQQNQIIKIPKTIKYMTSLDTLWLFDNRLSSLPDEINELPKLQCIWVYDNELRNYSNIKSCLFNVKTESVNE